MVVGPVRLLPQASPPLMKAVAGPPRVLFIHGLESGPFGSKARWMSERFDTVAPDMCAGQIKSCAQMSAYSPFRRNGPMQACLLYIAVAFTFCRVASRVVQGAAALTVAPVAICSFVPFLQWRMRRALHTCTSLIAKELQRRPPDIVVGSSWGSAVALRCLEAGYWAGPSLLLAPAVSAKGLWNLAWPSFDPKVPAAAASKILVVQGDADDTVPAENVIDMCRRNGIALEIVPGGDHRLVGSLMAEDERLATLVNEVATSSWRAKSK